MIFNWRTRYANRVVALNLLYRLERLAGVVLNGVSFVENQEVELSIAEFLQISSNAGIGRNNDIHVVDLREIPTTLWPV